MFLYTWYGTTYWTAKSVVNSNSVYETKTISGDLIINEKKINNNKKGWTRRFLRIGYMYTSAPSGPCSRHEVCMLCTANNE